jgi:hypothetical protein
MPTPFLARAIRRFEGKEALQTLEQRFVDRLRSQKEETTLVLTAHLLIEQVTNDIHAHFFVNPLNVNRLGFAGSVRLLRAINLVDPTICDALVLLNEIRNGFAHSFSSLSAEILKLGKGRSFRNSCSAFSIPGINKSSDRELFLLWTSKIYVELIKARYLSSEIKRVMMSNDFTDLFSPIDMAVAVKEMNPRI